MLYNKDSLAGRYKTIHQTWRLIEALVTGCTRKVEGFVEPLVAIFDGWRESSWKVRVDFGFSFLRSFLLSRTAWNVVEMFFRKVVYCFSLSVRHLPVDINGELSERSKELVSKTRVPLWVPRVRSPHSPLQNTIGWNIV